MMFDPNKAKAEKAEKAARRKALATIKQWALTIIPIDIQPGLLLDVKEVICGDPNCAPIDTVVTLVWKDGGRGMFALPLDPMDVQQEDLAEMFPTPDVLAKWAAGQEAEWPPRPTLRFEPGARVACRVGPHPVTGWAPGRVVKQFYREPSWPPNMCAPYQVILNDGRLIFAPQDTDNVIKARPDRVEGDDAPPSPDMQQLMAAAMAGMEEEGDDEEEDEEEGEEEEQA